MRLYLDGSHDEGDALEYHSIDGRTFSLTQDAIEGDRGVAVIVMDETQLMMLCVKRGIDVRRSFDWKPPAVIPPITPMTMADCEY